jgi:hypothetical protein
VAIGRVRVGVGLIYMLCFFRFLIDFDWIEGYLISDWVESGRVSLTFFKNQVGLNSGPSKLDRFLGSGRILLLRVINDAINRQNKGKKK